MNELSRRGFVRGLAGLAASGAGGCFSIGGGKTGKIRLACVGAWGKGLTDWTPMLRTGMAELVAICDADSDVLQLIAGDKSCRELGVDVSKIPFYQDYRRLLDDADRLGIEAMTISTPDHVHGPVAISAMKQGIHVYVQKPLVRTLWELDYFERTARDNGVIVQMGNQGSALDGLRRTTDILQSGILGDVREVHVWTNRPVWPQGETVANWIKGHPKGDPVRKTLDWNAWLATARERPYLGTYGKDVKAYDPWKLGASVYHRFTWRGLVDFGAGAFGDMACHTMNLAFRGLELGTVTAAECVRVEERTDIAFPTKSTVRMTYAARDSKVRRGVRLPEVTLYWYDGYDAAHPGQCGNKPSAELMPKVVKCFGNVPDSGCYVIGSKGTLFMMDAYGAKCVIALNDEPKMVECDKHEGARAVPRTIALCPGSAPAKDVKATVTMTGFAEGHYQEFVRAIRGFGPIHAQTHSRCFSDIEYCIPQMEGILVGCIAQQVPGRLAWDCKSQCFIGNDAANALVKPHIREGWSF